MANIVLLLQFVIFCIFPHCFRISGSKKKLKFLQQHYQHTSLSVSVCVVKTAPLFNMAWFGKYG